MPLAGGVVCATAGEDGNLKLWQLGGGLVGRFGHGTWDLSRDGRGGAATVVTGIRDDGRGYEVGEGGIAGTGEDCRWGGTGTGTGERSGGDGVSSLFLTHVGEDAADEIRLAAREAGGIQTPLVAEKELPPPDFAAETAGEMAEAVLSARGVPRSRGAHLRTPFTAHLRTTELTPLSFESPRRGRRSGSADRGVAG
mmetsp:Transcript_45073/g.149402  ORF Transcript_45073/g.149402 Transcript_45073/m.149402 type:complete len:196 (+) Transcript_45073:845-1432(+)